MTSQNNRQRLFALLLLALGCSDSKTTTYDDEAAVCLRSTADNSLDVTVTFPECFSSSCSALQTRSCSVELSANEVHVQSHLAVDVSGGPCTADCLTYSATCSSGPLPSGIYTVVQGTQSSEVTLPSTGAALFHEGAMPFNCQ